MNTAVHLISMPWADPATPSIQVGALSASLHSSFGSDLPVHSYSAFLGILQDLGVPPREAYSRLCPVGEHLYCLLCAKRGLCGPELDVDRLRTLFLKRHRRFEGGYLDLALRRLERATTSYLLDRVGPNLDQGSVNVIGFTLNYFQVYPSIFATRLISELFPEVQTVFLYGGQPAAYPEVAHLLKTSSIKGLRIIGEGELKLAALVEALLDGKGADEAVHGIVARDLGIIDIDAPTGVVGYDPPRQSMEAHDLARVPDPDYDEYFQTTAAHSNGSESTDLVLEGSRGCYGLCTFCGVRASWASYRRRRASSIVETTLSQVERYGTDRVFFSDTVANPWIEPFLDELLAAGRRLKVVVAMRPTASEKVWAKLALLGAEHVQVGIEALAERLLGIVGKKTRSVDNLRTLKYLKELDVCAAGILITHYPGSTERDVVETMRVLELIPHLCEHLTAFPFALVPSSPIYESLQPAIRESLIKKSEWLPLELRQFSMSFGYELPGELALDAAVSEAWDGFVGWFNQHRSTAVRRSERLQLRRNGAAKMTLEDHRWGQSRSISLGEASSRVYDLCHAGASLTELERATGLEPSRLRETVDGLVEDRVLVEVSDRFLSLATRPREELLANLG